MCTEERKNASLPISNGYDAAQRSVFRGGATPTSHVKDRHPLTATQRPGAWRQTGQLMKAGDKYFINENTDWLQRRHTGHTLTRHTLGSFHSRNIWHPWFR